MVLSAVRLLVVEEALGAWGCSASQCQHSMAVKRTAADTDH